MFKHKARTNNERSSRDVKIEKKEGREWIPLPPPLFSGSLGSVQLDHLFKTFWPQGQKKNASLLCLSKDDDGAKKGVGSRYRNGLRWVGTLFRLLLYVFNS